MSQLRISPDQMRQRATEYKNQAGIVDGVIKKMDTLLGQLQSEWEGPSAQAYAEKYQELKPGFIKVKDLIGEIGDSLTKVANMKEQQDQDIANQFKG